jgi:hypothetical protein
VKSSQAYNEITGKPVTPKVMDWLHDLEERYGDTMVVKVMEDVAETGKLTRFLNVVSDRLASDAAMRRGRRTPHELDHDTLMAMVRGQIDEPERPFIYDTRHLTPEEYTEVLEWAQRVQRGLTIGVPA